MEARKEAEFGEDTTPQLNNGFVSKVFSALGVAELRSCGVADPEIVGLRERLL